VGAENIIYSRLSSTNKPTPNIVKSLVNFRVHVSFLVSAIFSFASYFIFSSDIWPLFLLPAINSLQSSNFGFMQKNRDFRKIFALLILVFLAALLSVCTVFSYEIKGIYLIYLMILPELFATFAGLVITKNAWYKIMLYKPRIFHLAPKLLPYMLPSFAVSILVVLYTRLDVILVLPLLGTLSQANYSIGFRLVEPVFLILSLGSLSLLAELGSHSTSNSRFIAKRLMQSLNVARYFFLILASFILAYSFQYISLHFLNFSAPASGVTFFLALAIPIKLCNTFFTTLLQRNGRYNIVLYAAIVAFLCTMIFGLILGNYIGVVGIAVSTLIAESLNFLYQKYQVKKMFRNF
jgi:O-antigen/teichoic acid export membrane protein